MIRKITQFSDASLNYTIRGLTKAEFGFNQVVLINVGSGLYIRILTATPEPLQTVYSPIRLGGRFPEQ